MSISTPRPLQILNLITAAMFLMALGLVFLYVPREATMGEVQRIFYFHVASAWIGFLAFFVAVVTGTLVLAGGRGNLRALTAVAVPSLIVAAITWNVFRRTDEALWQYMAAITGTLGAYTGGLALGVRLRRDALAWDRAGVSSVEIGIVFSTMTLISGMLWARPIWNLWWTWDPRLLTFSILLLIYFAYLMLRQGIEDPDRRARFASVYGIVGFLSVPLTWFSIRWWRTIHPVVIGSSDPSAEDTFNMEPSMVQTLLFSIAFFTMLYLTLLWHRLRLAEYTERVEQLKAKLTST